MTNSRETFASFHREAAESDWRLWSEIERIFAPVDHARAQLTEVQNRAFGELYRTLERRRFTAEEITEEVKAYREQYERGEY